MDGYLGGATSLQLLPLKTRGEKNLGRKTSTWWYAEEATELLVAQLALGIGEDVVHRTIEIARTDQVRLLFLNQNFKGCVGLRKGESRSS